MNCRISAPGKVILHGEHSVVYGKSALVGAIGLRTCLDLKETDDTKIVLNFSNLSWKVEIYLDVINKCLIEFPETSNFDELVTFVKKFVKRTFNLSEGTRFDTLISVFYLLFKVCLDNKVFKIEKSFDLTIKSDLTIGAGSGSSASFGVCVATAFLVLSTKNLSPTSDSISSLAFESEKIHHINPSGVDNTICSFGGIISFSKSKGFTQINLPEGNIINILLVDTGVNRSTANLVKKVAELHNKFPKLVDNIFDCMQIVVDEAIEKYSKTNFNELEHLFEINNGLLRSIGVSHTSLEEIFKISAQNGFSSKLTGAGGGGFAIVLLPANYKNNPKYDNLIKDLHNSNFKTMETSIGGEGVTIQHF